MNKLAELKHHIVVHARGQQIAGLDTLLARIDAESGDGPGSWPYEWGRRAEELADRGRLVDAARHFAIARFPYVDGPQRQHAQDRCVATFERWRAEHDIERLDLPLSAGRVRCWATGLSAARPRPVLLMMGGIVTIKEQWGPTLPFFGKAGFATVVTEMPGTGENEQTYGPRSWRMIPELLDRIADRADVDRTYVTALSFAGHMALRAAADDPRVAGVVTAGAPVRAFFHDRTWLAGLPDITTDTLAHLTRTTWDDLVDGFAGWALSDEQLTAVRVPVAYVVSRRDEIIPPAEIADLRRHLRDLDSIENDDTHGSPNHATSSRLWTVAAVLRMRGDRDLRRAVVSALAGTARIGARLRRRSG
ncbi:alpha/beta fold hydrolase [Dactylosporangium sp. CA-233914]|uniref:alpha/beta fold hydrolase n=1 Tax=Dactylosporangium sp. CA-233914 TaxID=3239934 RepID=UPI003D94B21F